MTGGLPLALGCQVPVLATTATLGGEWAARGTGAVSALFFPQKSPLFVELAPVWHHVFPMEFTAIP